MPGWDFRRFTDSEIKGYRAAFSAIATEFESLGELRKQLEKPATVVPSPEKEICTSQAWRLAGAFNFVEPRPKQHFALPEAK